MAKGGKKGGSSASKSASAAAAKVQEDVWAQCDNPNCQKWRRLPPGTIIDENTPWYCYMNPDEENAACEAPEESYRLDVELQPGYEEPEYKAAATSRSSAKKSKGRNYADKGKSSSWSNQPSSTQWQGTQRAHSGGSSQGTKRRIDSDPSLDPPYDTKRARTGSTSKPAEADGHNSPGMVEPDAGSAPDLQGASSGGLRHSLRPKRPPSYPLKEESPPPQGPARQHQGGSRQGQGGSRPPSGQSQKAQAAALRPTQKARKQHKGFEKLLALGGLWEIVKGKGKAITPAPFWVWEGLATHTPAAAELAAQAADVASAARYFEGGNFPSGAALATEAAALKRQAMTAAAVLGLDATSQIPDVVAPVPCRPTSAAVAAALKQQQAAAAQSQTLSEPGQTSPTQAQRLTPLGSAMPASGRSESLSQILSQTQPQAPAKPQPQSALPTLLQSSSSGLLHPQSQLPAQSQSQLQQQLRTQLHPHPPAQLPSQSQSAHPQSHLPAQLPEQSQLAHAQAKPQLPAQLPSQSQSAHPQSKGIQAVLPQTQHQQPMLNGQLGNTMQGQPQQTQYQQPGGSQLLARLPQSQPQHQQKQKQQQQGQGQLYSSLGVEQFPVERALLHGQQQPSSSGQLQASPAVQPEPLQSSSSGLLQQHQASPAHDQGLQAQPNQAPTAQQLHGLPPDSQNGSESAQHLEASQWHGLHSQHPQASEQANRWQQQNGKLHVPDASVKASVDQQDRHAEANTAALRLVADAPSSNKGLATTQPNGLSSVLREDGRRTP